MSLRGTSGVEIRFSGADDARDITPFVRRFQWVESMIAGGFNWELQLATDFWSEWDEIVLGSLNPQFRLKFQTDGGENSTDWRTAVVDSSRVSYRSTAMTFMARGADRRLDLMQIDRTRAWPGSTVSEVVRSIGSEYGFDVFADRTTRRTDRWQARETDWNFMHSLANSSASGSGRGDLYLWMDEDRLRLEAPQLQRPSDRLHVMQEIENRVDRIVLSYMGRQVDRLGGATVQGVGFDPDTKTPIGFQLDAAAAATHPALSRRVPRAQGDGLKVYPTLATSSDGVEEAVRGSWGKVAPRYFALRLDTRPDLALRPGSIIEIQGTLGFSQDTAFLGRFVVLEVSHLLTAGDPTSPDEGGMVTTAVCYRREAYVGEDEPTGASVVALGSRDSYRVGQPEAPRTVQVAEVLP